MASAVHTAGAIGLALKETGRAGLDRLLPGGRIPRRSEDVTAGWLAEVIGARPGEVRAVTVAESHSGTAARARLALEVDPSSGLPADLFVKLVPTSLVQHAMMNLFHLGRREVLAYRTLGDDPPLRVPRCFAAEIDQRRGRNALVLEDLSATATFRTVKDSLSLDETEAVVDAMARLHIAYRQSPVLEGFTPIGQLSPAASALGVAIRRRLLGNESGPTADLIPADIRQACRIMFERSDDIDRLWASRPQTLLHGDPHLGNLFFEGPTPGFLDWQVAMSGVGIRDVAYFATVSVEPERLRQMERGLVDRYVARLRSAGIEVDLEDQWDLYRAGVSEIFMSAVAAAEAGEMAQPPDVSREGVRRAVAAVEAHDSFGVLASLADRAQR